jgi:DNA-binding CsgD family transcriptional regulator
MVRVAVVLSCMPNVRSELERLSQSRSGQVRMAERACIVLACLSGKRNDEIACEMGVRPNTVGQWLASVLPSTVCAHQQRQDRPRDQERL